MKEKASALYSEYVIDGIQQETTPARMLEECLVNPTFSEASLDYEPIVDESLDPSTARGIFNEDNIDSYIEEVSKMALSPRKLPVESAGAFSRTRIIKSLIDTIWKEGHFTLEDLSVIVDWKWNSNPLGNMAGFYSSVEEISNAITDMGITLAAYSYKESSDCSINVETTISDNSNLDIDSDEFPSNPIFANKDGINLGEKNIRDNKIIDCKNDWLIYIPFDTCEFRLGGSLLSESQGPAGHIACNPTDADYFIDCYEVVRELVEDGVAISGVTVSDGGIITALERMASRSSCGAEINVSGIMKAYSEKDLLRILFAEVPGVIIQIKDIDYDYIDAELLLQDIAWFPLGHPSPSKTGISIKTEESGLSSILQSLIGSQASEGED